MELIILIAIALFIVIYRKNTGENVYKFFADQVADAYNKYAPYSFKMVREKTKELGQEYTVRQYATQVAIFAGLAGGISYMYFYSIILAIFYATIAVLFVPYIAYLRCQRIYSEFIFISE